jgi:hypothetical protein
MLRYEGLRRQVGRQEAAGAPLTTPPSTRSRPLCAPFANTAVAYPCTPLCSLRCSPMRSQLRDERETSFLSGLETLRLMSHAAQAALCPSPPAYPTFTNRQSTTLNRALGIDVGTEGARAASNLASRAHSALASTFRIWAWRPREHLPHMGVASSRAPSAYGRGVLASTFPTRQARAASRYAMPCYALLRYATLCYAMLCYAMLCYAML